MLGPLKTKGFWIDLNSEISDDNVFNGAAALGFYLTLAIFPAFIVLMTILPYLPIQNVDQAIMDLLRQVLPEQAAGLVEGIVQQVTSRQRGGLLSFGIIATLWSASSGMYAIMQQLNITYDVKEERNFIVCRLTALLLSIAFVALVIGAFTFVVLGGVVEGWIMGILGNSQMIVVAFQLFRWIVIFLALLLGFALIYKFGPNVQQKFAFVTPGSLLGAVLLAAGSLAFAIYIRNFGNYSATYGSIGAVIILMLWLYLAGLVILVGSEVNALLEHYSPSGKRKGEKQEGARPGTSPRAPNGEREERRSAIAGGPSRPSLIPLAALLILKAFDRRRDADPTTAPDCRSHPPRIPGQ
jgi:membrane protein